MTAALTLSPKIVPAAKSRRDEWIAAGLSVTLHVGVVLLWLVPLPSSAPPEEPAALTVQLVQEPKPERPVPAAPKPLASEADQNGKADKSDKSDGDGAGAAARAAEAAPRPIPPKPIREEAPSTGQSPGRAVSVKKVPLTRSERDVVLSQVLRRWRPPRELAAFPDAVMRVQVTVRADGTLAPPFDASSPWNPGAAIEGYDQLPPGHLTRLTTEAFYRALRDAQPLRLSGELQGKAPFVVTLDFRYRDVR